MNNEPVIKIMSSFPASASALFNASSIPGARAFKHTGEIFSAISSINAGSRALPATRRPDEPEKEYIDRIISDSKEQGRSAADEGTKIHASIQNYYEGGQITTHKEQVVGCQNEIIKVFGEQDWISERSFAHEAGFGGKSDLYTTNDDGIVLDVKTKEFTDPKKIVAYDDNLMQLAAYRVGLGVPTARAANVYVSRSNPGLVVIKEWYQEDLSRGWEMFMHLLQFWQIKNKHR